MQDTLIIQSHRAPLPYPWIQPCLQSVREWSDLNQYHYRFIGDEIFDALPEPLMEKTKAQKVIATDLARLLLLKKLLTEFESVAWMDADFLIFDPANFLLTSTPYAVGREIWVQNDKQNKLKVYKKVHNAFLLFRRGNTFLDFYIETAERMLSQNQGGMPPQFIGPKLLTALHNVAMLPVMESAGMLSPLVVKDILQGGGPGLDLFRQSSPHIPQGVNLCTSSCEQAAISAEEMETVILRLLEKPQSLGI